MLGSKGPEEEEMKRFASNLAFSRVVQDFHQGKHLYIGSVK
jgi:hypothetical protein